MKTKSIFLNLSCVLALTVGLVSCATTAAITASVDFGTQPTGGGACYGRGLCSAKPPDVSAQSSSGVNVSFQLSPNDKNILNVSFSLKELNQKQPQETQFVNPGMPNFNFEKEFDFTDPMFTPLHLQPNARILPSTQNTMVIDNDKVTISYKYDHN